MYPLSLLATITRSSCDVARILFSFLTRSYESWCNSFFRTVPLAHVELNRSPTFVSKRVLFGSEKRPEIARSRRVAAFFFGIHGQRNPRRK